MYCCRCYCCYYFLNYYFVKLGIDVGRMVKDLVEDVNRYAVARRSNAYEFVRWQMHTAVDDTVMIHWCRSPLTHDGAEHLQVHKTRKQNI